MEKGQLFNIINSAGQKEAIEIVMAYESEETRKQYVVYSKTEAGANDTAYLYASAMAERDGEIILEDISDEEWAMVKNKMKEIVQGKEE